MEAIKSPSTAKNVDANNTTKNICNRRTAIANIFGTLAAASTIGVGAYSKYASQESGAVADNTEIDHTESEAIDIGDEFECNQIITTEKDANGKLVKTSHDGLRILRKTENSSQGGNRLDVVFSDEKHGITCRICTVDNNGRAYVLSAGGDFCYPDANDLTERLQKISDEQEWGEIIEKIVGRYGSLESFLSSDKHNLANPEQQRVINVAMLSMLHDVLKRYNSPEDSTNDDLQNSSWRYIETAKLQ